MKKQYVIPALIISIFFLPLTAMAQGGDRGVKPPPATLTVPVDCAAGDTITEALAQRAVELTIEINGMCEEVVNILRSNLILTGANGDAVLDGIVAPAGVDRGVTMFGINTITIENLTLSGGRFGLGMNATFGVAIFNSVIEVTGAFPNFAYGIIAGSGSGSIFVSGTTITAFADGARGIWTANGSNLSCSECVITGFFDALRASHGSELSMSDSTVSAIPVGGSNAIRAIGGKVSFFGGQINGGTQRALRLDSGALASISGAAVTGRFQVREKSIVSVSGITHTYSGLNFVEGSSTFSVQGGSNTVQGDVRLTGFSNFILESGSTLSGALNCLSGSDAYCDNGADVAGSNCSSCVYIP